MTASEARSRAKPGGEGSDGSAGPGPQAASEARSRAKPGVEGSDGSAGPGPQAWRHACAAALLLVGPLGCLYAPVIEDALRAAQCGDAGPCPNGFACEGGQCAVAPAGTPCRLDRFASSVTACGAGPCRANGVTSCVEGRVADSCRPGPALAARDFTCDGVDDDCDGRVDDEAGDQAVLGLAAGVNHTCARLDDGSAWCWGASDFGQLGQGSTESEPAPARVELPGPVRALAASAVNTCAVFEDQRLLCWGAHSDFQLGQTNLLDPTAHVGDDPGETPATRPPILTDVEQVAVGAGHVCALHADALCCWGDNDWGQQGVPGEPRTLSRFGTRCDVKQTRVGAPVAHLSARARSTCVVTAQGTARCWGGGRFIGYGGAAPVGDDFGETPAELGDLPGLAEVAEVALGLGNQTCARLVDGAVRCWGDNARGGLGRGDTSPVDRSADASDVALGEAATQVALGRDLACARLAGGGVRCWGRDAVGFGLGVEATGDVGDDEATSRAPLVPLGQPAVDLALGEDHACALLADGTVRCWGDNRLGQLGLGVGAEARRGDVPAAVTFDLFCPSRED